MLLLLIALASRAPGTSWVGCLHRFSVEQELWKWGFSKGHRSAIPPEEGALKTCFPQNMSFSISIDLKWRDVEGEKRKETKEENTTRWKYDPQWLQTLIEISSSEVNSRQSQCFKVSVCSRKKPTELHMQPLCTQIPAAASFQPHQLPS